MSELNPQSGYWLISSDNTSFTYNSPSNDLVRLESNKEKSNAENLFDEFGVELSTVSSYYFLENALVDDEYLTEAYTIVSKCNGNVVGVRNWTGTFSDIPVMGIDGRESTLGYCDIGDTVELYIIDENGLERKLNGNINSFSPNSIQVVSLLSTAIETASNFSIVAAYPNPFNPSTTISFTLLENREVNIGIYNINGQRVDEVQSGQLSSGFHSFIWNASDMESGVYFIEIVGNGVVLNTQKVVLIK